MTENGRVTEAMSTLSSAIQANPGMAVGFVRVRTRWAGGTKVIGNARDFAPITVDEPPGLGGGDQGPTPVELLLIALGSCQEIVYAAYAEQFGIQLDAIEIELTGTIDLRGFLGIEPSIRPGFTRIETRVRLVSDAPEERLRELTDLVERFCPVQDMLTNPVPITTSLAIERPPKHSMSASRS